jgi:hypothetical protein
MKSPAPLRVTGVTLPPLHASRRSAGMAVALVALLLGSFGMSMNQVRAQTADTFPTTTAVVPGGTLTLAVSTSGVQITGTSITTCAATTPPPAASVTYTCAGGLNSGTLITQTFSVASGPIAETVTYNANGPAAAFAAAPTPTVDGPLGNTCFNVPTPFSCTGMTSAATIPGGQLEVKVTAAAGRIVQITAAPNPIGTCTTSSTTSALSPTGGSTSLLYTCQAGQSIPAGTTVSGILVSQSPGPGTPTLILTDNFNAPVAASPLIPAPVSQTRTIGSAPTPSVPTNVSFTSPPSSGSIGQPVTFAPATATTTATCGSIASYKVDFGDGSPVQTSTTPNAATHSYTSPGTFTVTMTVTDCAGGTASSSSSVTIAGPSAPSGPTVAYAAGWNLVSGPAGTVFSQAGNPLYTYQGNDAAYETLPNSSGVTSGFGYWAFFNSATTVALGAANGTSASVTAPAGHWVMIGNPSASTTLTVRGADIVYTYDATAGYVSPPGNQLAPGRGAWAISNNGGTITVSP